MRLTLRTLLAYLDDTLEPHEIKEIGQKVAESDAAQELVARLKQVTRRRRLTTPPPGGPGAKFDANTIAEYLDNELSGETVADIEKTCLESDVHLAEVASCHQILTLVLGEPALVPPTARERMYGLVKGREAIPYRKARSRDGAAGDADALERDSDDPLLPGLPTSRGWLLWALPVAAVLVLAVLAAAVWQALPDAHPAVVAVVKPTSPAVVPETPSDSGAPPVTAPVVPVEPPAKDKPVEPPPVNPTPPVEPPPVNPPAPPDRPKPPSVVRALAGQYVVPPRNEPSILVQRQAGQPAWKRLFPGKSEVFTTDDLVSLPGYNSVLDLGADGGARLVLHGHVPQFTVHPNDIMDFLMDSAVRLHQPEAGFDMDLTLQHGRIYLSNHKADGPMKVRLRFGGDPSKTPAVPQEVWDLTLVDRDTEIGVDLLQAYTGDIDYRDGEAPLQQVFLFVFPPGRAGVRIESREFSNLPAPFAVFWDNKGPGASASAPQPINPKVMPAIQAVWSKTPPLGATEPEKAAIQQMRAALDSLSLLMTEKTTVDAALLAARGTAESPMLRQLAVYAFGALDEPDKVLDVLCYDEDTAHAADRSAAVFTLRRWISRRATNGDLLYDPKKEVGLLKERFHLRLRDAEIILEELHDFPKDEGHKPATFDALTTLLRHRELSVRELAYWHLLNLSVGARVPLPPYNAAASPAEREPAVVAWKELVKNGDLPPPAQKP